jgi:hypothetical protein
MKLQQKDAEINAIKEQIRNARVVIEAKDNEMVAKNAEFKASLDAKDIELQNALAARDDKHKAERIRDAQAAVEAKDKEMAAKNAEFKVLLDAKDLELKNALAAKKADLKALLDAKDRNLKNAMEAKDNARRVERFRDAQAAMKAKDEEIVAKNAEHKAELDARIDELTRYLEDMHRCELAEHVRDAQAAIAAKNKEFETMSTKLNEATAKNDLLAAKEVLINAEKVELERSKSEFAKTVGILQTERESFRCHLEAADADLKERTDAAALKEMVLDASKTALNTRNKNITRREREDEDRSLKSQRKMFTFAYIGTRFDPSEFNALDTAVQIAKAQGCVNGITEFCVVTLLMEKRFKVVQKLLDMYFERDVATGYMRLKTKEKCGPICTTELAVRGALEAGTAWEWAPATA